MATTRRNQSSRICARCYARLENDELQEAIIQADAGGRRRRRSLADRGALDSGESEKLRKSALFWAGQREETPTSELVRVLREARDRGLREHAVFVLSQRRDDAATDALLQIARADRDTEHARQGASGWRRRTILACGS